MPSPMLPKLPSSRWAKRRMLRDASAVVIATLPAGILSLRRRHRRLADRLHVRQCSPGMDEPSISTAWLIDGACVDSSDAAQASAPSPAYTDGPRRRDPLRVCGWCARGLGA